MTDYLTTKEACDYSGKSESTIKRLLRSYRNGDYDELQKELGHELSYKQQNPYGYYDENKISKVFLDRVYDCSSPKTSSSDKMDLILQSQLRMEKQIEELKEQHRLELEAQHERFMMAMDYALQDKDAEILRLNQELSTSKALPPASKQVEHRDETKEDLKLSAAKLNEKRAETIQRKRSPFASMLDSMIPKDNA